MLNINGVPTQKDLAKVKPSDERMQKGAVAIIECFQEIPCNPCYTYCNRGAIAEMININEIPNIDHEKCNGCAICVSACPGLAIFIVDMNYSETKAIVKVPYEFYPVPQSGDKVAALNREGKSIGEAEVVKVQTFKQQEKTHIVWLAVDKELAMEVRNFKGDI